MFIHTRSVIISSPTTIGIAPPNYYLFHELTEGLDVSPGSKRDESSKWYHVGIMS